MEYSLPALSFEFDALEPYLSSEAIALHYEKHHAGYVKNLNKALTDWGDAEKHRNLSEQIRLTQAIRFHGGGHINHSLFWENLAPPSMGGEPTGAFRQALEDRFGDRFQDQFIAKSVVVPGSGWSWLGYSKTDRSLHIATTLQHDLLVMNELVPLLCVDLWEHAYYINYKNDRHNFLQAIFSIMNWKVVQKRWEEAQ